jgi:hypothetical protein
VPDLPETATAQRQVLLPAAAPMPSPSAPEIVQLYNNDKFVFIVATSASLTMYWLLF